MIKVYEKIYYIWECPECGCVSEECDSPVDRGSICGFCGIGFNKSEFNEQTE